MNYLDYIVIIIYLIAFLALGFIFKENKTGGDYFLGGRKTSWLPLSLSAMATQLSAISFISAPAFVGLKDGGGMQWLTFEFGVPLALAFLLIAILPTIYKSGIVSVYEYLENRFDVSSRLIISFVFQISRSVATGVMVYTMALILQATIQLDFWISILLIGLITMIYSFQGGMKAVIWGDVIQMGILFLGILICLFYGISELGGIDNFLTHVDKERVTAVDFNKWGFDNADGKDEFGFWPMVIGGLFLYASYYGTDQTQSQRLLSSRSLGNLKKMLLANSLLRFPFTLTYCIMGLVLGTLLFQDVGFQEQMESVYQANVSSLEGKKADLMVPVFIIHYLPNGVIGILIIAIMSAAMSTLSSTVNSLSAVTMEDFVKRFHPNLPDNRYMTYSKFLSIFWGMVCLFFAFFAGNIEGTVIEVINKISSVFYGPILAAFILAVLTKKTHALGANVGIVAGVLFNMFLWLYVPQIFWFWWNAIGCIVTVVVAMIVSNSTKRQINERVEVVYVSSKKEVLIMLGYFVLIIVFSVNLPTILK
ncbi:sodium:solute symporter [Aquimarina sp. ERC-38]|uniref:sodium:solute symporter n=1 Tax=Aquimarina sp. ERC-38 TaxID=2949996 RepID=UPI00224555D9|nr:sodium:solute symporter [Aquimarina sp. ERC-38]UZO79585.1 sodium:solute symporter [Aquimarina sp. ERC-38]